MGQRPRPPGHSYLRLADTLPNASNPPLPKTLQLGSEAEIARLILDDLAYIHGDLGSLGDGLVIWDGSHWSALDGAMLQKDILAFDGAEYPGSGKAQRILRLSRRILDDIEELVLRLAGRPACFDQPQPGIPFADAFIHVGTGGKIASSHRPEHGNTFVLDVNWDPSLPGNPPEGSLLSKFLTGVFLEDTEAAQKRDLLAEIAGAALAGISTEVISPKAVILLGEKAENGKSQFLRLLEGLIPASARASVSPANHESQRHLALLDGKRLNSVDEIGGIQHASEAFKAAVTGDTVFACRLYKEGFSFRPRAQQVFTSNALPVFRKGADAGLLRRLIVLRFDRKIPPGERIPNIGKLIVEDELPYLIGWAMAGAVRLSRTGQFTLLASSEAALRALSLQSNPIEAWLETGNVEVTGLSEDTISTRSAYRLFRDWAKTEGLKESALPTQTAFSQAVPYVPGVEVSLQRKSDGNYICGLKTGASGRRPA